MTVLRSFEINGKKQSFANWISNLSPQETPFLSMIKKQRIDQTYTEWQIDQLNIPGENAVKEASFADHTEMRSTSVRGNYTQIFRKTVKVSKTANVVDTWGRGVEVDYQIEKAAKEIMRDIEWAFLRNLGGSPETPNVPRVLAGVHALAAPLNTPDPYTGAIVHKVKESSNVWGDIRDLSYEMYIAGAKPTVVMIHPSKLIQSAALQELGPHLGPNITANRVRLFENTPEFMYRVNQIHDPWNQKLKIIPNRHMPIDTAYMFNPDSFTAMWLRKPELIKLDSDGSYDKYMIECEVSLRLDNPYNCGIFSANSQFHRSDVWGSPVFTGFIYTDAFTNEVKVLPMNAQISPADITTNIVAKIGTPLGFWGKANVNRHIGSIYVKKGGLAHTGWSFTEETLNPMSVPLGIMAQPKGYSGSEIIIPSLTKDDAGVYYIEMLTELPNTPQGFDASMTRGFRLNLKADGDDTIFPAL